MTVVYLLSDANKGFEAINKKGQINFEERFYRSQEYERKSGNLFVKTCVASRG